MKTLLNFFRLFAFLIPIVPLDSRAAAPGSPPIKAMLLTGQCSKYHNWAVSSPILKRALDQTGRFDVTVVTSPAQGQDMSGFNPRFSDYAVIVMDYDGDEWPEPTKVSFVNYMKGGGGLVIFHATDNAFPNWPEFNEMIGVGGWAGRTESAGSKVRWRDGKIALDSSPGTATHPNRHDFLLVTRAPAHPIMKGLPAEWLHASDELYSQLRGPAKNLEVLATASADPAKLKNATGENEPMLMAITYGNGRIFHTTLGHVGPQDKEPSPAVNCAGFIVTLQRGSEWAATGNVTQSVPADFPMADKTSLRKP